MSVHRVIKSRGFARFALISAIIALAGCTTTKIQPPQNAKPEIGASAVLPAENVEGRAPIMMRIFKEEGVLEIWKRKPDGKFAIVGTYEICKWSGKLGPKYAEGDRQAPEGFYTVSPGQLNPNSEYHLSFNIGFPNVFDRVNGRYGTHIMVHGDCSSAGCYSMDNDNIEEIYAHAREAFRSGQKAFQIQAFPFRMTNENMERYRNDPNFGFWLNLKQGYDEFERTKTPPKVDVCEKRYVFNQTGVTGGPTAACPGSATKPMPASFDSLPIRGFSTVISSAPKPSPSIRGIEEAAIVADWSKRRAKGEKVSTKPPSLSDVSSEYAKATLTPVLRMSAAMAARASLPPRTRMFVPPTTSGPRRF